MRYRLRPAVASDAEGLAALHAQVWRQTYSGLMPEAVLRQMDDAAHVERWRTRLAGTGPDPAGDRLVMVAEIDDPGAEPPGLAGFAVAGPPLDDAPPAPRQLYALNVLSAHHGTGVGNQLLDSVLGSTAAYLWVAAGNDRAIRFYRRHRFAPDGVRQHDDAHGVDELRMVRRDLR